MAGATPSTPTNTATLITQLLNEFRPHLHYFYDFTRDVKVAEFREPPWRRRGATNGLSPGVTTNMADAEIRGKEPIQLNSTSVALKLTGRNKSAVFSYRGCYRYRC